MNLRALWPVLAIIGLLAAAYVLEQRGREVERLQYRTDSLNTRVTLYQADSAGRQATIDSALTVTAAAESVAAVAARRTAVASRQRDSLLAEARADTGDVPRALFQAVVSADSVVIRDQATQIVSLGTALGALYAAFYAADSARVAAGRLLRGMTSNRDAWRTEARRANRIGLVASFAWTLPSGQWQAAIGIGKRIRLPGFLGGL